MTTEKVIVSEKDLQILLFEKYKPIHKYMFTNLYFWDEWECDWLSFEKSGGTIEIEIKTTLADFKDDFDKKKKHERLKSGENCPNRFYYCCEKDLIPLELIPSYAGLIEYDPVKKRLVVKKRAPFLNNEKYSHCKIFDKMYYNFYIKSNYVNLKAVSKKRKANARSKKIKK